MSAATTPTPTPEHDCGLCDGPLVFDGMSGIFETWVCSECGWWHISKDCCMGHHLERGARKELG